MTNARKPMPQLIDADRLLVESANGALGAVSKIYSIEKGVGYDERRGAIRGAEARTVARLTEAGATIRTDFQGTKIRFRGINSSSTGSLSGALSNWLIAARHRLSEQGEHQ